MEHTQSNACDVLPMNAHLLPAANIHVSRIWHSAGGPLPKPPLCLLLICSGLLLSTRQVLPAEENAY